MHIKYLVRYVGEIIQIEETNGIVYIGSDFSDEYANSLYTKKLKGALAKAKANMSQGIPQLVEIATKKCWSEDYEQRHKQHAKMDGIDLIRDLRYQLQTKKVGFYEDENLVAVMDLIVKYPNDKTTFIGFFMMDAAFQGKGIGIKMILDLRVWKQRRKIML